MLRKKKSGTPERKKGDKKGKKKDDKKVTVKVETRKKSPIKFKSGSEAPLPEIISETIVEYLHETEGESPVNLEWENFIKIRAGSIIWNNFNETPLNLELRNTAYNVILTAEWEPGLRPWVLRGPLTTRYEFAQAHFHWGPDSFGGSDHDVEGQSLPFEAHLVFYKASSGSLEDAKKEEDGIVTFCYLFKVSPVYNEKLGPITDNIKEVVYAYSTKQLEPTPIKSFFDEITDDYIVYLGSMKYKTVHGVTFVVSRDVRYISENQLSVFRQLKDRHENPMILKKREIRSYDGRNIFVVNPKSNSLTAVLHSSITTSAKTKRSSSKKSGASTTSSKSREKTGKSSRRSTRKSKKSSSKKNKSRTSSKKRKSIKKKRSVSKK